MLGFNIIIRPDRATSPQYGRVITFQTSRARFSNLAKTKAAKIVQKSCKKSSQGNEVRAKSENSSRP